MMCKEKASSREKLQMKALAGLRELLRSPNIDWSVYFSGLVHFPACGPYRWDIPNRFGLALFAMVLASNPKYSPQFAFMSHHYLFLTIVALFICAASAVYFSLNERRLLFEYIKDKHLTPKEERDRFEELSKVKRNIFRSIAFKIGTYIFLSWLVVSVSYLSVRIIVAMIIIDIMAFIAILLFARKMPLGRNALSLYDYDESEEALQSTPQDEEASCPLDCKAIIQA